DERARGRGPRPGPRSGVFGDPGGLGLTAGTDQPAPDAASGGGSQAAGRLPGQVSRFLDFLAVERGLSRNTLDAYRRDLARYLAYLVSLGVTDATRTDEAAVSGFVGWLSAMEVGE